MMRRARRMVSAMAERRSLVRSKSAKSAGFRSETTRTLSAVHQERGSGSPGLGAAAGAESGSRRVTGSPSAASIPATAAA